MTSPEEPAPPTAPVRTDPGRPPATSVRQVLLVALIVVAVIAILVGLGSLVGPRPSAAPSGGASGSPGSGGAGSPTGASSTPTASVAASLTPASTPSSTPPLPSPTPVSTPGSVVLVGAGDIANCSYPDDSATAKVIEGIPGTVFAAGDDAYPNGAKSDFRDCYGPTWGAFKDRTWPVPGNHDHLTPGLAGYLGYFGSRVAPNGHPWYSFDLGAWHLVMLDSECSFIGGCGASSQEGRWLAADLAASDARCTLAVWHEPRFSSGEHGDNTAYGPFWTMLAAAGADVVINGHDHDYERFAPQDPSGAADPNGIREFVVGTGGQSLRTFSSPVANSVKRIAGEHGVLKLTLGPTSYDWRFIPTDGSVTDAGSGDCH